MGIKLEITIQVPDQKTQEPPKSEGSVCTLSLAPSLIVKVTSLEHYLFHF